MDLDMKTNEVSSQFNKRKIENQHRLYRNYIKRFLDIILSLAAIIVLSPVFLILAILVRIKLGSPIIFKQKRPGLNGKIFTLYKFRTMTDDVDENGELLDDELRLTRFGRILRSTSMDELPELFNILRGDMSIIGPRPLLVEYIPYYTDDEFRRHDVRPGLTGLAQIKGRNLLGWDKRLELDIEYVRNISIILDIKIFFITIYKVLKRADIADGEHHVIERLDDEREWMNI